MQAAQCSPAGAPGVSLASRSVGSGLGPQQAPQGQVGRGRQLCPTSPLNALTRAPSSPGLLFPLTSLSCSQGSSSLGGLRGWRIRPETTAAPGAQWAGEVLPTLPLIARAPKGLSPSPLAPWSCASPGIGHRGCPSGPQPHWPHFPFPFTPPPSSTQSLRSSFWTPCLPTLPSGLYPSIRVTLYF